MSDGFFSGSTSTATARLLSAAASDNATLVASRPCAVKGIQGFNAKATAVYLKLYDKATAPTASDTPVKTIYLPASSAFAFDFSWGVETSNGLGFRITGAVADADATALVAGDILALNIDYS